MKKQFLLASFLAIAVVSCAKKEPETQTTESVQTTTTTETPAQATVVKTDSATTTTEGAKPATAEKISTKNFEGDGKKLSADFMGDQQGTMSVKISVDGKDYTLPQKEAWAKGAVYSDGKIEFTNKGQTNEAELKMDGKTYAMKEVK